MTYKDDLKQHLLVDLHEFLVPLVDVGRLLDLLHDSLIDLHRVSCVS
jgi:hypothetical protein